MAGSAAPHPHKLLGLALAMVAPSSANTVFIFAGTLCVFAAMVAFMIHDWWFPAFLVVAVGAVGTWLRWKLHSGRHRRYALAVGRWRAWIELAKAKKRVATNLFLHKCAKNMPAEFDTKPLHKTPGPVDAWIPGR